MPNRPSIPAEISREVLIEAGHRCAVCGVGTPLERAHIIPWHKSKEHRAQDLICLCANCHQRADLENWGERTLRQYKEKPWILRQYEGMDGQTEPTTKLKVAIDIELENFNEKYRLWLQFGLAAFLDISPDAIQVCLEGEGSVIASVELPVKSAKRLLEAYKQDDPELAEYLSPLILLNVLRQSEWFSVENLQLAWKFARIDLRDDFVFDVIDHADIKHDPDLVLQSLHNQIKNNQYHPAPLLSIDVSKSDHSVRPGAVIPVVDLIVLYAIVQQLVPLLDRFLADSVYAYRLNPEAIESRQHLFKNRDVLKEAGEVEPDDTKSEESTGVEDEIGFPYNWFVNWKLFHDLSQQAAEEYTYVAVTDITAYFENISLDLLREALKEKLGEDQRELVNRLFRLLEYWEWAPTGNLPRGIGLPQGNDVSSFLSNLYLVDLDQAMLGIVDGNCSKYYRYVDDIRVYTSDRDEARRALVELERVLRTLNLNVQSAKTKILPAKDLYDPQIEAWLKKMSDDEPDQVDYAIEFFKKESNRIFAKDDSSWQRPYSRCLTVLRRSEDDRAVDTALALFLNGPSYRLLTRNFVYLRNFVASHSYGQNIATRLMDSEFTFPYHRAFMYRLAAYSRDNSGDLKQLALQEASNTQSHWFCRMAAIFCLSTFPLDGKELAQIFSIVETEANPQLMRAAFVALCQYSGQELRVVLDRLSFFNAPHQDYLRRYFFRLYKAVGAGQEALSIVKRASVKAPTFIHNLHRLDLLKTSSNKKRRAAFRDVIEMKLKDCENEEWPRLKARLSQVLESFIVSI